MSMFAVTDQVIRCWTCISRSHVQIPAAVSLNATLGKLFTHIYLCHQVAGEVTMCLEESSSSLTLGLRLWSHVGWLPRSGISSSILRSYDGGTIFAFYAWACPNPQIGKRTMPKHCIRWLSLWKLYTLGQTRSSADADKPRDAFTPGMVSY